MKFKKSEKKETLFQNKFKLYKKHIYKKSMI